MRIKSTPIFCIVPDTISSLDLEPSFDLKFPEGALNGLDALASRVGNRLIVRPRLSADLSFHAVLSG